MASYIGAVDLGMASTRFSTFNKACRIVAYDQKEHRQIFPKPGLERMDEPVHTRKSGFNLAKRNNKY
jgi:glycerol kinase